MNRNRRALPLVVSLASVLLFSACGGGGSAPKSVTWSGYSYTDATTTEPYKSVKKLAEETIPEVTDGSVRVTMHPGGSLGIKAENIAQAVGDDSVQFASDAFYQGTMSLGGILSLPMLYESRADFNDGFEIVQPALQDQANKLGVEILGQYLYPPQTIFAKKPVTSLADVKGLKVRVSSPQQGALIRALGGDPITLGTTEVATSLQRGLIDAVLTASSGGARSYSEMLTHNYRLQVNWVSSTIEVNKKKFDSLPAETQRAIKRAVGEAGEKIAKSLQKEEGQLTQKYENKGMVVTKPSPADKQKATELVEDYWQKWASKEGPEAKRLLKKIQSGK